MDQLIERVDAGLRKRGYESLPLQMYEFYKKTDAEIVADIREKNKKRNLQSKESKFKEMKVDPSHGSKMVLKHYFKWLDSDDKNALKVHHYVN